MKTTQYIVRNKTNRPIRIKEIRMTIPVSNNNYVISEKVYNKYKEVLNLIEVIEASTVDNREPKLAPKKRKKKATTKKSNKDNYVVALLAPIEYQQ